MQRVAILGLMALAACSDALEQTTSAGQVVASVNTTSRTVSLVSVDNRSVSTIAVPAAGATPQSVASMGSLLAVPGGAAAGLAVFDFSNGNPPAVTNRNLPGNGGATGVALENDSIAWVANPNRDNVTRVNLRSGDTASFPAGVFPQAVAVVRGFVYVVNGNLVNGAPAGASWITVRSASGGAVPAPDSIPLTGTNARSITVGGDGFLYVVDAGDPGKADGRLSIVDPQSGTEQVVVNGLGKSPGAAVYHPSGRLLIASPTEGVLVVNTSTRVLQRGPGNGIKPKGAGVAALALDEAGRVYAFDRGDCTQAGVLYILSAPPEYGDVDQVTVGVCPSAAATILVP